MKNEKSIDKVIQVDDFDIGKSIAELRKSRNLKQTEMVARLQIKEIDISTFSYNRIEKGTQNPTVSFLLACCEILECDMNEIFGMET